MAAAAETTQLLRVPVPQPSEQTLVLIQDLLARDDTAAASGNYLALQRKSFSFFLRRSGSSLSLTRLE